MKRICLVGAAVAGLFTAGITTAASAATKTKTVVKIETKTVHSTVACKPSLTVQIPAGATSITQGSGTGSMLGESNCGTPLFSGLTSVNYTLGDTGGLTGPITEFFKTGSIKGTVSLSPAETGAPPTTTTFTEQSYTGTVTVTGGTEALKGVTGSGTISCSTPDAIHYTCTDSLKLSQTVKVPVKTKVTVHVPAPKKASAKKG